MVASTARHRARPLLLIAALALLLPALAALLAMPTAAVAAGTWTWPVEGEVLTAYLNGNDPYAAGQHRGIDIGAAVGSPVRAATDGTVTFAGTAGSSGLTVAIRTSDDRFDTSYLHLDSIAIREGQAVEQGSELGTAGVTGRRSVEAPHVHFGVRDAGERHAYRDPLQFLEAPGTPVPQPPPPPVAGPVRPGAARTPEHRPAPVPSEPAPAPAPGPVPSPRPSGTPAQLPSPKGAPSPAAHLAPEGAPLPLPGDARRPLPLGGPRTAPRRRPSGDRVPASSKPHRAAEPVPGHGGFRPPEPALGPAGSRPEPEATRRPAGLSTGGLDLGWALGCAGLAVAAAVVIPPRLGGRTSPAAPSGRRSTPVATPRRRLDPALLTSRPTHPEWGRSGHK